VGVLFMLQTWIATDLSAGMHFGSPETAFYEIAERAGGAWLRHLVFPLIGMLIIAYVLYEMDRAAKILGLGWIVIGAFYYLVLTLWIKKPVALKI
jgi:hypothetical protein